MERTTTSGVDDHLRTVAIELLSLLGNDEDYYE